ncbi:MAG: RHS repeat-associated core domain-containing protein [Terricaulis silvestris]
MGWYFPSPTPPSGYNPATQATALSTAGAFSTTDYEAYTYDANSNRTSLKKRDGQLINYSYDALNRMTLKDVPGGSANDVYYGYDLRGLQVYARFGSASGQGVANAYDGFGRLVSTTNTLGGVSRSISHTFDADSDRTRVTFPDSAYFTYAYDGLDRLTGVLESGATSVVSQSYYATSNPATSAFAGSRSGQTRGGVASSYLYDPVGRPTSWADDLNLTAADVATTFGYNAASQIIARNRNNDSYAFTGFVNGTTNYVPNGLNQYASVAAVGFTYDPNGNLTSDGANTYAYDVENRLISVSGAHSATLTYDPLGRLSQIVSGATTTQFLYDGDELVAEYNSSGLLLRRYVHGPGVDDPLLWYEGATVSASTRRSLQQDYQGSIVSVADSNGAALNVNTYDEYGVPGSSNAGRFQYTGQAWLPEVGLYYYKARIYAPALGRFLQTDPVGYKDDVDLYTYVRNDPLNSTDWLGTQTHILTIDPDTLGGDHSALYIEPRDGNPGVLYDPGGDFSPDGIPEDRPASAYFVAQPGQNLLRAYIKYQIENGSIVDDIKVNTTASEEQQIRDRKSGEETDPGPGNCAHACGEATSGIDPFGNDPPPYLPGTFRQRAQNAARRVGGEERRYAPGHEDKQGTPTPTSFRPILVIVRVPTDCHIRGDCNRGGM